MSSNLWKLYKNYRCPEIKVLKDLSITNSLSLQCNTIDDVSGINFCDGTYIGHGSSFDITTDEQLKINTDAIIVNTDKTVGIGTDNTDGRKFAVEGNSLVRGTIDTERLLLNSINAGISINGEEVIDSSRNINTNKITSLTYPNYNIEFLNNVIRFDISYGYVEFDVNNDFWCHIITSLERFYINKPFSINNDLYMYGGSASNDSVVINNKREIFIRSATFDDTSNNIVLLGGTSTRVTQNASNAFYVKPIRNDTTNALPNLVYDTSNAEIKYETSSKKYKTNIINLSDNTDTIHKLQAREYYSISDNKHSIGYIAEEAYDANTNFTWKNTNGTPEGIAWNNILVYAIEEIKKLRNEVNILKQEINVLKGN